MSEHGVPNFSGVLCRSSISSDQKHPHDAVIRAWLDGRTVQCRESSNHVWNDIPEPSDPSFASLRVFCAAFCRIKPPTITYRVALFHSTVETTGDDLWYVQVISKQEYGRAESAKSFVRWVCGEQEIEA